MNTLWGEIVEPPIEEYVDELELGYGDVRTNPKEGETFLFLILVLICF